MNRHDALMHTVQDCYRVSGTLLAIEDIHRCRHTAYGRQTEETMKANERENELTPSALQCLGVLMGRVN